GSACPVSRVSARTSGLPSSEVIRAMPTSTPKAVLLALAFALVAISAEAEAPYQPTAESLATHPLPQWYQDAKFGIFAHWGAYSDPAYAEPTSLPFTDLAEWYWKFQQTPGSPTWLHHLLTYGPWFLYDDFIPRWRGEHWNPRQW